MKKHILIVLLVLSFNISRAQRYGVSPDEGQTGLIIAGILFLLVAIITVSFTLKKTNRMNKEAKAKRY